MASESASTQVVQKREVTRKRAYPCPVCKESCGVGTMPYSDGCGRFPLKCSQPMASESASAQVVQKREATRKRAYSWPVCKESCGVGTMPYSDGCGRLTLECSPKIALESASSQVVKKRTVTRKRAYLCPACKESCGVGMIKCSDGCGLWVHMKCAGLSKHEFDAYSASDDYFLCKLCVATDAKCEGFDYQKCLNRLKKAPTATTCSSERRLLRMYNGVPSPRAPPDTDDEDSVSLGILKLFHPVVLEKYSPRCVGADGNCYYRAVAKSLFGTEDAHMYVRVMTAMELIEHRAYYDSDDLTGAFSTHLRDLPMPTSPYRQLLSAVTTVGTNAEVAHFFGTSAAFNIGIRSYMPQLSVVSNYYTFAIFGRGVRRTTEPRFVLMWTMINMPRTADSFNPNHIVLLRERRFCTPEPVAVASEDDDSVRLVGDLSQSPDKARVSTSSVRRHRLEMQHSSKQQRHDGENFSSDDEVRASPQVNSDRSPADDRSTVNGADQPGQLSSVDEKVGNDSVPQDKETPLATGMRPLPSKDGVPTTDILATLQKPPVDVLPRIPRGNKNNAFCVVDNSRNVVLNAQKQKSVYDDDCGVWWTSAGHTTQISYLVNDDGSLKRTYVNAQTGKYYREVKFYRKRIRVDLDPQPDPARIITLSRNYMTLEANSSFRRRVTVLKSPDAGMNPVAVVEYFGNHVVGGSHGNSRREEAAPFQRTPAATVEAVADMTSQMTSNAVHNKLIIDMDVVDAPRNTDVITNNENKLP